MSTDPFRPLRIEYLERARSGIKRIEALAAAPNPDAEALSELRVLVHNLRGSGGFYGFADISATAATIEQILLSAQDGVWPPPGSLVKAAAALTVAVREARLP